MKGWTYAPARLVAGVLIVCALGLPASALAATGGDANAGDVWVDTVSETAGPGHEMDPHLPCADINLWGDKLADSGGSYTIDGWPPSGSKAQAYSSTWKYDGTQGGTQVIDVINVQTLIANAAANGDAPVNGNGYHFKLEFSQDPQKHKTFWVNCPPPSSTSAGTPGGGTDQQQSTTPAPSGNQQAVLGERVSGHSRRTRRRHRVHRVHRKHHRVRRQAVLPAFTG